MTTTNNTPSGWSAISLVNRPRKGNLIQVPEWGVGVVLRSHREWLDTMKRHKKWLNQDGPVYVLELLPTTRDYKNLSSYSDEVWGGLGPWGKNLFMVEASFPSGRKRFIIMVPEPTGRTLWPKNGEGKVGSGASMMSPIETKQSKILVQEV